MSDPKNIAAAERAKIVQEAEEKAKLEAAEAVERERKEREAAELRALEAEERAERVEAELRLQREAEEAAKRQRLEEDRARQEEINRVDRERRSADSKKTPVRLLFDTWADDEKRIPSGTVLEVPVSIAKQLIDAGKAERADPLPGDAE
ncbi:hypothetical protein [Sinorhizobium meliloti]|uniref:hypothetical protein n=1 Tax=Rhizobium meliloti TaxID=382 RepID=UPI001297ED76|nr:hypothetical protein [Sinorhizobium meliloti]